MRSTTIASPARISVIMPVHNGAQTLGRAMSSLLSQSFSDWELVAIDDGSTDGTQQLLNHWASRDERIRVIAHSECRGPAAARNVGLRLAVGTTITYLDCDDEYFPHYLDTVAHFRDRADVLVFGYDRALDKEDGPPELDEPWDPASFRGDLFCFGGGVVTPLGVAHTRDLGIRIGGFDENVSWNEDGELWKRLARAGATFLYLRCKSGRYHLREGSQSQVPNVPVQQIIRAETNFRAGKPLYHSLDHPFIRSQPVRRILFASAHSVLDFSNGAAVATLDLLQALDAEGFQCQAFCAPIRDFEDGVGIERIMRDLREPHQIRPSVCGSHRATIFYTRRLRVPITIMGLPTTGLKQNRTELTFAVLGFFRKFLEAYKPDVMLTYGRGPVTAAMIALAKRWDIPVVFAVHLLMYRSLDPFWRVDYCITPSEFARRFYWENLGLACSALPNPVDWSRVRAQGCNPRYVTFVNPSREKGVYPFARIADELGRRRPDIPLLVVESRGTRDTVAACGLNLSAHSNIRFMANTSDPQRFWGVTRIALMPSLCCENQPLVAIEAMINGIPTIGSDRGGIPETLGEAGILLSLPEQLQRATGILPTAEEVEPWVETIIGLWDDRKLYDQKSYVALEEAQRWHPDRLRPLYAEFFRKVHPQPGPPFLPGAEIGVNSPFGGKSVS